MKKPWFWIFLFFFHTVLAQAADNTLSEADIKAQLSALQGQENSAQTQNLGSALYFVEQGKKQQQDIDELNQRLKNLPQELQKRQQTINTLKNELENVRAADFEAMTLQQLEMQHNELQNQLQTEQLKLAEFTKKIADNRNLLANNQKISQENQARLLDIQRLRQSSSASKSLQDKLFAESEFLSLNNRFNALLSQNAEALSNIEELNRNESALRVQLLQRRQALLQEVLNQQRLAQSENLAEQIHSEQLNSSIMNFLIQDELDLNKELSQFLIKQTQQLNALSQDNLRVKSALESLTQTRQNIDEQISALQGTLILSKIINKQKELLPTETLDKNLAKTISELRVNLFEYTQQRDELHNIESYIQQINDKLEEPFTEEEERELTRILQARYRILDDITKSLNQQLNTAISIDSIQGQVNQISDTLQNKLQQQSFWVKSNNPLNLDWVEEFPVLAIKEVREISPYLGFDNLNRNFAPMLSVISVLLLFYIFILRKKPAIKQRLSLLASKVNTLKSDSHWHTPEAMLWTIILALPSTLMFLAVYSLIAYLFFFDPFLGWAWGVIYAAYWLFFATLLSLFRPNGMAFRHFGMPQASNVIFHRIIKHSIWIVALLVVSSLPSSVERIGFSNDVIGQVMTIIALALCLFVVRPLLDRGMREYENSQTEDGGKRNIGLFKLLRLVLILAPITLIMLIILGYYYTAVYLINHLVNTYFIALCWVFGRYFAYRSVTISARRMAYRRLLDKREKLREMGAETKDDLKKEEDKIKLSVLNKQIFQMTDLIGWVILFALLYVIWSDLIGIANYLNNVILWESSDGVQVESITLLNLMRAVLYVVITYALVKNISGIMEVTFYSRMKFSKGTPQTITAILTYLIVIIGSFSAFTSLGISWGKIQWIFTALSVGLGFGVREIFGSFVSGSILLFERPIRVGDKVTVGEHTGVITKIRLRSTTLINSDHMEVVLPNQAFVTGRFINWTLNNTITRLQILFKVHYGADLKLVRELLKQAVAEAPKVLSEPKPEINILHFGDNALEHELLVFVGEIGDRTDTNNFLHYRINELFKQHQIRFAFNQLDVHLYDENRPLPPPTAVQTHTILNH